MMMRFCLACMLIIFILTNSFAKDLDLVELRAIMLVHADLLDFKMNSKYESIDSISKSYEITELDHRGVALFRFFKIKPKTGTCLYYLSYNDNFDIFYRLSGFSTNEFNLFYDEFTIGLNNVIPNKIETQHGRLQYIIKNTLVEGIQWDEFYKKYYKRHKKLTACIDKKMVIVH